MKIKLCGIRRDEDADFLNEFPPDYAGFIFADTRRRVTPEKAAELRGRLSEKIKTVGVFVNEPLEKMHIYKDIISVYQLHGDEDENYITGLRKQIPRGCEIWKAVRVRTEKDISDAEKLFADMLLLDAFSRALPGGTGKAFDHEIIGRSGIKKPFFLAGGIDISNMREIIEKITPYGIDISSGIETDGIKDREKIKDIMNVFRKADVNHG